MTKQQWFANKIDLLTSAAERAPLAIARILNEKVHRLTRQAVLLTTEELQEEM